jgi:hypothetical protein
MLAIRTATGATREGPMGRRSAGGRRRAGPDRHPLQSGGPRDEPRAAGGRQYLDQGTPRGCRWPDGGAAAGQGQRDRLAVDRTRRLHPAVDAGPLAVARARRHERPTHDGVHARLHVRCPRPPAERGDSTSLDSPLPRDRPHPRRRHHEPHQPERRPGGEARRGALRGRDLLRAVREARLSAGAIGAGAGASDSGAGDRPDPRAPRPGCLGGRRPRVLRAAARDGRESGGVPDGGEEGPKDTRSGPRLRREPRASARARGAAAAGDPRRAG